MVKRRWWCGTFEKFLTIMMSISWKAREKSFHLIFFRPRSFARLLAYALSTALVCERVLFLFHLVFLCIVWLSSLNSYRYTKRKATGSVSLLVAFYGLRVWSSQPVDESFISVSVLLLVFHFALIFVFRRCAVFSFFLVSLCWCLTLMTHSKQTHTAREWEKRARNNEKEKKSGKERGEEEKKHWNRFNSALWHWNEQIYLVRTELTELFGYISKLMKRIIRLDTTKDISMSACTECSSVFFSLDSFFLSRFFVCVPCAIFPHSLHVSAMYRFFVYLFWIYELKEIEMWAIGSL